MRTIRGGDQDAVARPHERELVLRPHSVEHLEFEPVMANAVAAGKHYLDPAVTEKVTTGYAHRQTNLHPERQGNLSEREEDILRRIAWGYSNKEIAAYLEISVKTVEAHKANTMKKLGLQSRIDIVRYAVLQGWLQDN